MTVIGIDPGIEKTGVGIVKKNDRSSTLIFSELIKTDSKLQQQKDFQLFLKL